MSKKKETKPVLAIVKLQIPAGEAKPSPPIGPALGQRGANIMQFCKQFNEETTSFERGIPIPVEITIFVDKSFIFKIKTSPASYYIKKYANITSGSKEPGKNIIGEIFYDKLLEIAKIKLQDMNCYDIASAAKVLEGTAISMGLEVKNNE